MNDQEFAKLLMQNMPAKEFDRDKDLTEKEKSYLKVLREKQAEGSLSWLQQLSLANLSLREDTQANQQVRDLA